MKKTLIILVLLFSSSVLAEIYSCKSKQVSVVEVNSMQDVMEDAFYTYKIMINRNKREILFIDDVLLNGKTLSENSKLFTSQVWTITSGDHNEIRAYGSLLGEIMFTKDKGILTMSFPLGNGQVGVTIIGCYQ